MKFGMLTLFIDWNPTITLFFQFPDFSPIFPDFPDFGFFGYSGREKSGKSDGFLKNRKIC